MTVYFSITVDWEGYEIIPASIKAMKKFNEEFPDTPLEHFICPSYFTRCLDNKAITEAILSVIKPIDDKSLHVHCWYSLVGRSVSPIIKIPTWNRGNDPEPGVRYGKNQVDYGHPVPLGLYTKDQIAEIISGSRKILALNNVIDSVDACTGFRCGGWMSSDVVLQGLQAIVDSPFLYDCSGAPYDYCQYMFGTDNPVYRPLKGLPLMQWLGSLWGKVAISSPSYLANQSTVSKYPDGVTGLCPPGTDWDQPISPPEWIGGIVEIPNTGMLADYVVFETWKDYIDRAFEVAMGDVYLCIGFHQESAADVTIGKQTCLEKVREALLYFRKKGEGKEVTRQQMAQIYKSGMSTDEEQSSKFKFLPA